MLFSVLGSVSYAFFQFRLQGPSFDLLWVSQAWIFASLILSKHISERVSTLREFLITDNHCHIPAAVSWKRTWIWRPVLICLIMNYHNPLISLNRILENALMEQMILSQVSPLKRRINNRSRAWLDMIEAEISWAASWALSSTFMCVDVNAARTFGA